ncbi:TIM barrel protein [Algoriphagus sp. CAU 1675]|uniref:TIM barrel protein n=1 Tax=Algoriphagus sp. CAU 1675 TaxID=3032597 RepID=UPI0023D9F414|nr:TIM barrel protein [Algoriphagus sp. CAU 1675]MDF2159161.1 TIM barrel protein [Algoriphagus sp. CAU 1675]
MKISQAQLESFITIDPQHSKSWDRLSDQLNWEGKDVEVLIAKIQQFQIAVPSWALGAGGTRFGRFSIGGEPRNLDEKLEDIGLLAQLTKKTDAVSLHIPWDIPEDPKAIKQKASELGIGFDAMNSNTFQDYGQELSYKFGSLSNADPSVRRQAVEHNLHVIEIGKSLGSKGLTVWLADGSNFPGQANIRKALDWTGQSLKEIYSGLPSDWKLLLEYKPYEPNFYHTVIPDWGTSALLCRELGEQAKVLVDLGHHLPNTNIEQIVATLMYQNMLAGFHFNDSKYGDDDLSTGSVKPYQLFLIFNELIGGSEDGVQSWESISWMIDASHNTKDPLEDLIQALEAIAVSYAKALLIDRIKLHECQMGGDLVGAQEVLQEAFLTDVRPLVREARLRSGGVLSPLEAFRKLNIREKLVSERGRSAQATGL